MKNRLLPSITLLFVYLLSPALTHASASNKESLINEMALKIVLQNSGVLTEASGETLAEILAKHITTQPNTNNKVSNSCKYDPSDELFKCTLSILNTDDSEQTESGVYIQYELEDKDGLPSEDLFQLSISVTYAG